jgi:rhodanese-related sulfurtransferase
MAKKKTVKKTVKIKVGTKNIPKTENPEVKKTEKLVLNPVSILIKAVFIAVVAVAITLAYAGFKSFSKHLKNSAEIQPAVQITPAVVPAETAVVSVKKRALPAKYSYLLKIPGTKEAIQKIHLEEAKALFDSNQAIFVDARGFYEYQKEHITGAISIPAGTATKKIMEFDSVLKGKIPVAYCHGIGCHLSDKTAAALFYAGYKRVLIFFGGWNEWTAAKYPVEKYEPPSQYKYLYDDNTSADAVKYIKLDEAKFLSDNMSAVLLDVDPLEKYNEIHPERTTSFPLESMDVMMPKYNGFLAYNPIIIISAISEDRAKQAAKKLFKAGHKKLMILPDAVKQWEKAGYPVVKAVK